MYQSIQSPPSLTLQGVSLGIVFGFLIRFHTLPLMQHGNDEKQRDVFTFLTQNVFHVVMNQFQPTNDLNFL